MKKWIVLFVLGVPSAVAGLLLVFVAATVLGGIGDPLEPVLGPVRPYQRLAIWLWLGGTAIALAILILMAWFAPWGVLSRRRSPREQFRTRRGNQP
jgi:hypothetical protein